MIRGLFLIFVLIVTNPLFSQATADSLDQYNTNHKKTGWWTVYLDEYTNQVDKEKAVFIGYELYDNGTCVFPFAKHSGLKKISLEFDGQKGTPGQPVPISGTVKFLYASGKPSYEDTYKDGRPVILKAYRYDKYDVCCMTEILDYQKRYNNTDGSFYYQHFGRDNQIIEKGYYRDGEKGWIVYEEE